MSLGLSTMRYKLVSSVKLFQECTRVRRKVVVLESCDADNLIRNEIQFQLFHRNNLAIQQGF